ncbi:MAG TPA: WYL domain-containing protein [Coriobacteriia bacterium]|nr:WYL domain-containing protein [Coriobacteriia bacterium]
MPRGISAAERAQRLMALLGQLTPDARLRVSDLAAEIGATEEELAADLETLSVCGVAPYDPDTLVPVFVEDGWVEVWGELPAVQGPIRLSAAEAGALAAALQAAGFGAHDPLTARLIEAAASTAFDAEDLAATLQAASTGHDAGVFETLSLAAAEREVVAIDYVKAGSEDASHREIEPVSLYLERGAWYLTAWCRSAGDWRTFRIDRVRAAKPRGSHFEERLAEDAPPSAFAASGLPVARLDFAAGEEFSDREWPGARVAEQRADGSVAVDVPYSGTDWIARQVVARLGGVTVVSPPEVRTRVAALAADGLARLG